MSESCELDPAARLIFQEAFGLTAVNQSPYDVLSHVLRHSIRPLFDGALPKIGSARSSRPTVAAALPPLTWKAKGLEIWHAVDLALRGCTSTQIPSLWGELLPPTVTLIQDYELKWKICGLRILSTIVKVADAAFLERSGLLAVLDKPLLLCYSFSEPEWADAATIAFEAHLGLASLVDSAGSDKNSAQRKRYENLHRLLQEGVLQALAFAPQQRACQLSVNIFAIQAFRMCLPVLGVSMFRYTRFIMPYLVQLFRENLPTCENETMLHPAAELTRSLWQHDSDNRLRGWVASLHAAVSVCFVRLRKDRATRGKLAEAFESLHNVLHAEAAPAVRRQCPLQGFGS